MRTKLPVVTDCRDCGACCSAQGTPPMMPDEYDALPPLLKWDRRANADRYDRGLPCLWFDLVNKICVNYQHRPSVCREFVVGSEDCLTLRANPES